MTFSGVYTDVKPPDVQESHLNCSISKQLKDF